MYLTAQPLNGMWNKDMFDISVLRVHSISGLQIVHPPRYFPFWGRPRHQRVTLTLPCRKDTSRMKAS